VNSTPFAIFMATFAVLFAGGLAIGASMLVAGGAKEAQELGPVDASLKSGVYGEKHSGKPKKLFVAIMVYNVSTLANSRKLPWCTTSCNARYVANLQESDLQTMLLETRCQIFGRKKWALKRRRSRTHLPDSC
jgi:hypothetical protein